MRIFFDESGHLEDKNESYFVVASFSVDNPRQTEKALRSWFFSRFPKKMSRQSEIKWSANQIDVSLRIRTLKHIASLDIDIKYCYILKSNIPRKYFKRRKLESGHVYADIFIQNLKLYFPSKEREFHVFCDQIHLKNLTKNDFKDMMKNYIKQYIPENTLMTFEMLDSTSNANMQIADWLAGAFMKYLQKDHNGQKYFDVLQNKISAQNELFK